MIQPLEQLHQYTHQIHQLHNSFQLQFKFLKLRKVVDKNNVEICHFKHFFYNSINVMKNIYFILNI